MRYFLAFHKALELPEPEKINFAAGRLNGVALLWFESVCLQLNTYAEFEAALLKQFAPFVSEVLAREQLYSIRFQGPVQAFAHQFRALVFEARDMSDLDQALLFINKLPHRLMTRVKSDLLGKRLTLNLAIEAAVNSEHILSVASGSQLTSMSGGSAVSASTSRSIRCFHCNEEGHMKRDCPRRKAKRAA
jgi:hypothetical protein